MADPRDDIAREERILASERSFANAMRRDRTPGADAFEGVKRVARALYILAFFAVAAGAVVMGVAGLRFVSDADAGAKEVSLVHGVLTNAIKANDLTGSICVGDGPEGDALVMRKSMPSAGVAYETRIYLYQGFVVQEFGLAGYPYVPRDATRIAASSSFSVSMRDGVVRVTTDGEEVSVALRSAPAGPVRDAGTTAGIGGAS